MIGNPCDRSTATGMYFALVTAVSLLCVVLLSGCSGANPLYSNIVADLGIAAPPLPASGDTIANVDLQTDVLNLMLARDGTLSKTCKVYGLTNTELTQPPQASGGRSKWKERWTLDRCGTVVRYDVEFIPDLKGGTSFVIGGPS